MDFENGHIAIYGSTESGKTTYAKALLYNVLKPNYIHVFLGSLDWNTPINNKKVRVLEHWGGL
jgi:DNA helicase HerA-like ATPase